MKNKEEIKLAEIWDTIKHIRLHVMDILEEMEEGKSY